MCMWELDHNGGCMPKNWCFWAVCGIGVDSWESPCKEIKPVNPKGNQSWVFISRTDAEAAGLIRRADSLEKKPWCWERLKAGGEGDDRGRDGWMASPTQWTCVWANSGRWWRTGEPGMLQSMKSQRVRHNLVTEQQQQNKTAHSSLPQAISSVWKVIPVFTSCLSFHTSDWR